MSTRKIVGVSGFRMALGVWWIQWSLGLSLVVTALVPWLMAEAQLLLGPSGKVASMPSLLPHAALQLRELWLILGTCLLLGAFLARTVGRQHIRFTVLLGLGMLSGWLAAAYQSWTVLAQYPEFAAWTKRHVFVFGSSAAMMLLLFWLVVRSGYKSVALGVALLSFAPGMWLGQLVLLQPLAMQLQYVGPVLLGIVLGRMGFVRLGALVVWCLALLIQWLTPAVLSCLERIMQSNPIQIDRGELWGVFSSQAGQLTELLLCIATLAAAMLMSVFSLVASRLRQR